jgi:hypothetical protein
MFFHHGCFPHFRTRHWTRELGVGMQLASAFIVEQELEESRMRSAEGDQEVDRFGRPVRCHREDSRR